MFARLVLGFFHGVDRGEDRGATAAEYALLIALIALAIFVGVTAFGQSVSGLFDHANDSLPLNS